MMAGDLNAQSMSLLRLLVGHLAGVDANNPATFITYGEAHSRLGLTMLGPNVGKSLQSQGLDSLAGWVIAHNLPAITGLIVREIERDRGKGFFDIYRKDALNDILWWLSEIARAKQFDWKPYTQGETPRQDTFFPVNSVSSTQVTIRHIAHPNSKFFLKSVYG